MSPLDIYDLLRMSLRWLGYLAITGLLTAVCIAGLYCEEWPGLMRKRLGASGPAGETVELPRVDGATGPLKRIDMRCHEDLLPGTLSANLPSTSARSVLIVPGLVGVHIPSEPRDYPLSA